MVLDVRSGQAHICAGFGLTFALGTTRAWHRLSNAISTARFGGRGDARRPFLDRYTPDKDTTLGAFSDVFQRRVGFFSPLGGVCGSSLL